MIMLDRYERVMYNKLVNFKTRFVPPYKSSMACHPPEGFEKW